MLIKYQSQIVLAIFAIWVLGFAFQAGRSTQHQDDRKQIEASFKASHPEQRSDQSDPRPNGSNHPNANERSSEATEVSFIGLKLGEALLVFVTVWLVLVTKALVDGSAETAQQQLRAYVSVDTGSNLRQSHKLNLRFEFRPNIVNNGLTPANDVRIFSRIGVVSPVIPEGFDYTTLPLAAASTATLMPRQTKFNSMVYHRYLDGVELRQVAKGETCFHLYGKVTYTDIFKKPRTSRFSFIIFAGKKNQPTIWRNTDHNNDCD
jgi:hypothetical protein